MKYFGNQPTGNKNKREFISRPHSQLVIFELGIGWFSGDIVGGGEETIFMPILCNQCNRPPCVRVCPTKATYKDKKNGIVMMNESLCIGCKACMTACPYNARYYNREIQAVDKCDFCYRRRLQNGATNTACAEACPAGALLFGDLSEHNGEIYRLLHKPEQTILVLRPESGSMPNVFYLLG